MYLQGGGESWGYSECVDNYRQIEGADKSTPWWEWKVVWGDGTKVANLEEEVSTVFACMK